MSSFPTPSPAPSRSAHVPVMLREVIRALDLAPGQVVVDATVGAGGHSREILARIGPSGLLIGLDRDAMMLDIAARHLSSPACRLVQASYAELPQVLSELQIPTVDRLLLDLGLSSDQLADETRGFSFSSSGPLDLRFDVRHGRPAAQLLAQLDERELADLLYGYGEEPDSRRIARQIVERRARRPIVTARDLADVVASCAPRGKGAERHPATRVFQALRIAVNQELEQLQSFLGGALCECLKPEGIVAFISFHSLEDRLVKQALREPTLWQPLSPRPILPSPAEQRLNPRSRSAKLRAARRLPVTKTLATDSG
ncbi:MAG: 16S rRNA (cytosine(1402)-N(4))-methyltransferase RsmH [Planctomycetaceae bacterium]